MFRFSRDRSDLDGMWTLWLVPVNGRRVILNQRALSTFNWIRATYIKRDVPNWLGKRLMWGRRRTECAFCALHTPWSTDGLFLWFFQQGNFTSFNRSVPRCARGHRSLDEQKAPYSRRESLQSWWKFKVPRKSYAVLSPDGPLMSVPYMAYRPY